MKNKGEVDIKYLLDLYSKELGLTKKEARKIYSEEVGGLLDSLRHYSEEELIENLAWQKVKAEEIAYMDYYKFLVWKNIYVEIFKQAKNGKNQEEIEIILKQFYSMASIDKFREKRFKAPDNLLKFITEIKLLQKQYPSVRDRKLVRQKTINEQKNWVRGTQSSPISVTHEIFKELNPTKNITSKGLSDVRTKIKRAKKKGFL